VIGHRARQRRIAPIEAAPIPLRTERALPAWRSSWLWLAAGVPLYVAVFVPTFIWFLRRWTHSVWTNSHGILVVIALVYLLHRVLASERDRRPEASPWGLALVGLGLLMASADVAVRTHYLGAAGFLVTLPGLSLALLGPRLTRTLGVPLAVAWLMLPVPRNSPAHHELRLLTASAVEPLLQLIGIPTYRHATVIEIPRQVFTVANDCSGFSTLYASIAVAVVLAVLCRSLPRRMMLLAAAPILAMTANVLRVFALILLTGRFGTDVLDTLVHPVSGMLMFAIALGGLFWIAGPEVRDKTAPT
jgi:exosortase